MGRSPSAKRRISSATLVKLREYQIKPNGFRAHQGAVVEVKDEENLCYRTWFNTELVLNMKEIARGDKTVVIDVNLNDSGQSICLDIIHVQTYILQIQETKTSNG